MNKRGPTDFITKEIDLLKQKGLYIQIPQVDSPISSKIKIDGKEVLNFCSNNYLGLANNTRLKNAAVKAIRKYGIGAVAVRTIAGTTTLHTQLEKSLAKFKKVGSVVAFQSGFTANLGVIPTIAQKGDVIFSDELNHASIIDGCRLSSAEIIRYEHTDTKDLEEKVKIFPRNRKKIIITDGVFSMDGDIAPLPEIQKVAEKYECILIVDDAHGEGVLGKNGRGIVDHFRLHGKVDVEIGTMSKAFGVVGGYAAGKKHVIEFLKQRARPFLFSSALSIPDAAACIEAVKIMQGSNRLVKRLWDNTYFFKKQMCQLGFDTGKSETPIIPVMIGDVKLAKKISIELLKKGLFAKALGFPTVPKNTARIRLMMSATHKESDLKKAAEIFELVGKSHGVIS